MIPNNLLTPPTQPASQPAGPRPAVGSYVQAAATRLAAPRNSAVQQGPAGVSFQQLDPGWLYQVDVYDGTSWGKIGEIWAPSDQSEVWGLYDYWSTYQAGPVALYLSVLGNSNTYADLAAFKYAIKNQDPNQKPQYWEAKKI